MMEISRMRPRTSQTAWQLSPNIFFQAHMNSPRSHPTSRQSSLDGLWIQIRIPSLAVAQQLKPAPETFWNPCAIRLCWSWSFGYSILNFGLRIAVDGIYNIPEAFYCVGVTSTVGCHEVIWWSSREPSHCTCKADIWHYWSIRNKSAGWQISFFLASCGYNASTKLISKCLKVAVLHSIHPPEKYWS